MSASARVGRAAAVAATVGFAGLAAFQLALALGAPLGEAAWGGTSDHLSSGERVGSAVSVLVYLAAARVVLGRAGVLGRRDRARVLGRGTWLLVAVFSLSALANFASQSPWERFLLGPLAAVLAVLCTAVASATSDTGRRPPVPGEAPPRAARAGAPPEQGRVATPGP